MPVWKPRDFVITNAQMVLNDIWQSILWASPFLATAPKPMCRMIRAGSEMLSHHLDYFRAKPVNILKTTILLDNGYHPDKIATALQAIYAQIMTKIRLQLAPKPSKAEKAAQGKTGFIVVVTRWIIERTNA